MGMMMMIIKRLILEMGSVSSKSLIETIGFFTKTFNYLSSDHLVSNNPLFSIVIALYSLILLYFPRIFLDLIFSPVLISTGILLSTLLRLGSIQKTTVVIEEENHGHLSFLELLPDEEEEDLDHWVKEEETKMGFSPKKIFVEWNVRAPLEVIYEEYEGQEEEEEEEEDEEDREMGISGFRSLARYYPESDTGSSSDGDFPGIEQGWDSQPENMIFRWEEEDKEGGLIEIELDVNYYKRKEDCDDDDQILHQGEEENLIEIEISPFGSPMNKWREFQQQRGSDFSYSNSD